MIIILQRLGSDHSHLFNSVDNIMKNYCERFLKLFSAYVFLQKKISTCTVEHPLSACHPIAYFPLSNPSFHFSVDYCCSNNSKCSASLS